MTMSEKIAEVVDGFGQMNARQQTIHKWLVTSWRNDSTTAHMVNLLEASCTCEDYQFNLDDGEACAHILKANHQAQAQMDVGEALNFDLIARVNDLNDAVDAIERRATGVAAEAVREPSEASDSDTASSNGGGSTEQPEDDSLVLDGVDATDDEQAALDELQSWFNKAAGFNGFDGEIIDLTVTAIADHADHLAGERVIEVERQPFSGGYYDDGGWQDKEAFDEHKETVGDSILSPRDEFSWFGEPDYAYVIRVDDVAEVTE